MEYIEDYISDLKLNGFCVIYDILSELDTKKLTDDIIPNIDIGYSDYLVERKLYRKREETEGRVGGAVMVSLGEPDTAPFLKIDGLLGGLFSLYNDILGGFIGEVVSGNSKSLFNYQYYKEGSHYSNSIPYHFDAEVFDGEWGKDKIEIREGLIPRLVMVVVLENENGGKGLCLMNHAGEVFELNLAPGDTIIFDNTKFLHGVPNDLPNKRTIIGFRCFESKPLYFKKGSLLSKEVLIKIDTPFMQGEAIELTTEEAKEMLVKKGWYYD